MNGTTIEYRPARSDPEFMQILELQRENQPLALSVAEMEREGFVTLTHTLPLLRKMQARCPQLVAVQESKVLGYALCLHPELATDIPDLAGMFREVRLALGDRAEYRVMGQVCIAKPHRGRGLFRALYQALRDHCAPYPLITEVSVANSRSLAAHLAIGFTRLARRGGPGEQWEVLIWQ